MNCMSYDHPTYTARHVSPLNLPAVAASVTAGKFIAFTDMKIKRVDIGVNIAGTATAAGYDLFNGTSSLAQILAGTSSAGTILTPYTTDITLSSGGYLDIKTAAVSATMAASAQIEFEIIPGALVTA